MKHFISLLLLIISPVLILAQTTTALKKGMIITHSAVITKATYNLNADTSLKQPLIIIEGKNIVVDFNQSTLQGSNDADEPNKFYGLAVLIKKGCENITLKNANIHGYKVAVMADSVTNLVIDNNNFSYNYRQHLHSNIEREDISDWMSYHHNENDEWLRYGAGIYLKQCKYAVIKYNTITGGQCGLMMTRGNSNEVYDNNFSFNSGIGIGMYRSSNNKIYHNNLDFNVRGFSFGKYYRGQDSAGILVFEQCNNNVFAYNSATHSGDGFFLWAGQYTMDTGEGGCNDNLIYGNDFSYAPTNGVEVTFSRNQILFNDINECDNGIWAGYSYNTTIGENNLIKNNTGIAIEHGQEISIFNNQFDSNKTAIKLWAREKQPQDWGYAKKRDTKSRDYVIVTNTFNDNKTDINLSRTKHADIVGNNFTANAMVKYDSTVQQIDSIRDLDIMYRNMHGHPFTWLPDETARSYLNSNLKGRNQIRITEWGPYNFEYPLLWLNNIDVNNIYHFEVLAKTGTWKPLTNNGFKIINQGNSNFPSFILAKPDTTTQDRHIRLQYAGAAFADAFGKYHSAGTPYYFEYREFKPLCKWNIDFYTWDSLHNPNNFETFTQVFKQKPVHSTIADKVDYTWWGGIGKNLPADSFATIASTIMDLSEADYIIGITDDDFAKVFIDGKQIIDAWVSHYVDLDETTHHETTIHLKGKHTFKIVHAEISGLATLMFYIQPKTALRSLRTSQ